jgi:hypothetical protein
MKHWFDLSEEDEQAVTAFMSRVAALPAERPAVDPVHLWWKAQLLRRWDAERRAQLPLDVMDVVQIAGAAVAAGLLLVWSLPTVMRLL